MLKIAICDDDNIYIQYMEKMLIKSGLDKEVAEFYTYNSGPALLADCNKNIDFDALFLDVQMNGMDGNETAKYFRKKHQSTLLIFCSGVYQPTVESFKVTPFRYLLKQYTDEVMLKELSEIIEVLKERKKMPYIVGKHGNTTIKIKPEEILYISVAKRGSHIYVCAEGLINEFGEKIACKEKVSELYKVLKFCGFAYAHNSYIVNLQYIVSKRQAEVELTNGTILTISRSKEKIFRTALTEHLAGKYE